MAIPQLSLIFIGLLAVLATISLFVDLGDRWTNILVTFLASIVWGVFGISSYDVYVDEAATVTESVMPLVVLGIGFSGLIALYGFLDIIFGFGEEAAESDIEEMMG